MQSCESSPTPLLPTNHKPFSLFIALVALVLVVATAYDCYAVGNASKAFAYGLKTKRLCRAKACSSAGFFDASQWAQVAASFTRG